MKKYTWLNTNIELHRISCDRTLGRKNGGVITYITATEELDAEQLIAKSNSYVKYQLILMQKRNIVIINVYRPPDWTTENINSPLTEVRTKRTKQCQTSYLQETWTFQILTGKWKQQMVEPMKIRFKQMPFSNLHRNNAYSNK